MAMGDHVKLEKTQVFRNLFLHQIANIFENIYFFPEKLIDVTMLHVTMCVLFVIFCLWRYCFFIHCFDKTSFRIHLQQVVLSIIQYDNYLMGREKLIIN
jgi:hypothetical protein